jgi:lambda family phage tail tape measure protein
VGLQGEALLKKQKEQAITEAIARKEEELVKLNEARLKSGKTPIQTTLTGEEEAQITGTVGKQFDLQTTGVVQGELQTKVNELLALRDSIQAQIQSELERGNTGTARALEGQLGTTNGALRDAAQQLLDYQIANAEALGLSSEALDTLKLKQDALNESTRQWTTILGIGGQQIANTFTNLAVNAIDKFAQAVANGQNAFGSLLTAFREFAANFLIQIAQMIQQQIIFNLVSGLLSSIGGGLGGGAATNSLAGGFSNFSSLMGTGGIFGNPPIGTYHAGGIVGQPRGFTAVSAAAFTNATRYHSGGIAGLKPGEVPSILMQGEEVLTRDDPRHMLNGGGGRGDVKIVNTFDEADFFSKGANTKAGEKAILNLVRSNPRAFKQAMSGS